MSIRCEREDRSIGAYSPRKKDAFTDNEFFAHCQDDDSEEKA